MAGDAGTSMPSVAPSDARPASRWARLVRYLPVAVLVLVALNQIRLATTTDLTAWKGGGFGMFSTIERPETRYVRCFLVGPGREGAVQVPLELQRLEEHVRNVPSERNLARLARELAADVQRRLPTLTAVRVEVWERELDLESGTLRMIRWRQATHEVGDAGG